MTILDLQTEIIKSVNYRHSLKSSNLTRIKEDALNIAWGCIPVSYWEREEIAIEYVANLKQIPAKRLELELDEKTVAEIVQYLALGFVFDAIDAIERDKKGGSDES
jgi:hypothetical protein